jgi:hypothetical protein
MAEQIAERAAHQNQRREQQSIGFDDPLHVHHGCMKAGLQRRQSNIDDRAVDESHAGTENGGGKYPRWCCRSGGNFGTR